MSREALMYQILAAPDDDTPRLVLADVLSQAGDPQGELIVVQCALAKLPPSDPSRRELVKRERELLGKPELAMQEQRLRQLFPIVPRWRRGFISEIAISADWLKQVGTKVFAEVPLLDALDLEACATCYGKLIPELERVRTLSIAMGTSECIAHLDDPAWRNVRELTIRHTPVGKAMNQLCGWKTIKPRVLRLLKASIAETGARVLASAKLDVEVLDLRDNPIGDEAEAELRAVYGARVVLSDDDVGKPPKKAKARAATR